MINNVITTVQAFNKDFNLIEKNRDEVRHISGNYYIPGESCIKMSDDKFHRINNGKIFFNYSAKKWQFGKENLTFGVVGSRNDGTLITGFYSDISEEVPFIIFEEYLNERDLDQPAFIPGTRARRVASPSHSSHNADTLPSEIKAEKIISLALAEELECIENLAGEGWVYCLDKTLYPEAQSRFNKKGKALYHDRELPYNLSDESSMKDEIITKFQKNLADVSPDTFDTVISSLIGNVSFGLEIETSLGHIPKRLLYETGLVPLRDGSVGGIEYTTVPLDGEKGLNVLRKIYHHVNKRCLVDEHCSLHMHFGGTPFDKKSVIVLYSLAHRLQEELFEIVPPYKRSLHYWTSKKGGPKDHCKPLPGLALNTQKLLESDDAPVILEKEFDKIWKFLTNGGKQTSESNYSNRKYPRNLSRKWEIKARYYWLNFLPLLFSDSKTIEFRLHQGTIDYNVMLYWMLICTSLLKFASENADIILAKREKITLYDIIDHIRNVDETIYNNLLDYIEYRRNIFTSDRYDNLYREVARDNANNGNYPKLLKDVLQRQ